MINHVGWLGLGAAMGWLSVLNQQWTVSQIEPGRGAIVAVWFVLGAVLRWTVAAALLFFAIRSGLLTGLAAAGGLILARWLALVYYTQRI